MTVAPASSGAGARPWTRRILVGVLLAVVGLGAVAYPPAFAVLVALVATGCTYEFTGLSTKKGTTLEFPVALCGVYAYLGLTYAGLIHLYEGVLLALVVVIALGVATFTGASGYLSRSGFTLMAVLYIGKLLTYFLAIRAIPQHGAAYTVLVIFAIAFTDIGAMLIGTRWGRTPLNPISPRKTWEGAIGGLLVACAVCVAAAFVPALGLAWWQTLALGALTSVAAQAGDLVESGLKRDARVKDAGSLIGGHGGVLDRFDSYLFGGIAFYATLWMLGLLPQGRHLL